MDSPDEWLQELMDQITPHMSSLGTIAPIGCHTFYDKENDLWEISLFSSMVEILGGEDDGTKFHTNFVLDLKTVIQVFDEIESLEWQALPNGSKDGLGSHLSFNGQYEGHSIWLRILANAPKECEVGQIIDAQSERVIDLW